MLVIILLGITLKYSNLCTFSWFLVKLAIIVNKNSAVDCARFVESTSTAIQPLRTATRTIHSGITRCARWRGLPWSITIPLSIRNWPGIKSCCSHAKQLLQTCAAGLEREGEGRKRERGLGREGKGIKLTSTLFPFHAFLPLPSPPLPSHVLRLPRNF